MLISSKHPCYPLICPSQFRRVRISPKRAPLWRASISLPASSVLNTVRRTCPLRFSPERHLEGANLLGVVLSGAQLMRANLSESQIVYANLQKAVLLSANLSGAFILDTDLSGAQLAGANLENAQFPSTKLYGADFFGASLKGADFSGAVLSKDNGEIRCNRSNPGTTQRGQSQHEQPTGFDRGV